MRARWVIALAPLLTISACSVDIGPFESGADEVDGSGNIVTEQRSVGEFTEVVFEGEGRVTVAFTDGESLEIEADDNLLDHLEAEVRDDRLVIKTGSGIDIDPSRAPVYRVTVRTLRRVELRGVGSIELDPWATDQATIELTGVGDIDCPLLETNLLDVRIEGVGSVTVEGTARRLTADLTGTGNLEAGDLSTVDADVRSTGVGNTTVWVSGSLTVEVTGVGDVSYYGSPSVEPSVEGLGSLESLGEK